MIEMFKIKNELAPLIMFETRNESYNLHIFYYGLETLSYRSPQLLSLLPENIKEVKSLKIFKKKLKN